jgi:hypothetical protein
MIELIIINSLIIWGVYASIQEGFIFERFGNWMRGNKTVSYAGQNDYIKRDNLPSWIKKPLGTCPVCMSSVYSTPVFWFSHLIGLINYDYIIIVYILYIFAIAGLNYLILAYMSDD